MGLLPPAASLTPAHLVAGMAPAVEPSPQGHIHSSSASSGGGAPGGGWLSWAAVGGVSTGGAGGGWLNLCLSAFTAMLQSTLYF